MENAADINAPDMLNNNTPLHYAIGRGHQRMVQQLLTTYSDTIDVTRANADGDTLMHCAAAKGATLLVQQLLQCKASVRASNLGK